jgi:hypothetical protein
MNRQRQHGMRDRSLTPRMISIGKQLYSCPLKGLLIPHFPHIFYSNLHILTLLDHVNHLGQLQEKPSVEVRSADSAALEASSLFASRQTI